MILQRIRIIVGEAGFESRNSASEVWCATNHYICTVESGTCKDLPLTGHLLEPLLLGELLPEAVRDGVRRHLVPVRVQRLQGQGSRKFV